MCVCVCVCVCVCKLLSHFQLFMTPWTLASQAPLSMGFSRQEYWSGLPFPSPEDLPNSGIEPRSPALQVNFLPSKPPGSLKNGGHCQIKIWGNNRLISLDSAQFLSKLSWNSVHCQVLFSFNNEEMKEGRPAPTERVPGGIWFSSRLSVFKCYVTSTLPQYLWTGAFAIDSGSPFHWGVPAF